MMASGGAPTDVMVPISPDRNDMADRLAVVKGIRMPATDRRTARPTKPPKMSSKSPLPATTDRSAAATATPATRPAEPSATSFHRTA